MPSSGAIPILGGAVCLEDALTTDITTSTQITKKELFNNYRDLRSRGLSPAQILGDYLLDLHDHGFSIRGLVSVVVGVIAFVIVDDILGGHRRRRNQDIDGDLWIVAKGGGKPVKLPFWVAARVIRKHEWMLADVEPVQVPLLTTTRWEHLKIALGWRMR